MTLTSWMIYVRRQPIEQSMSPGRSLSLQDPRPLRRQSILGRHCCLNWFFYARCATRLPVSLPHLACPAYQLSVRAFRSNERALPIPFTKCDTTCVYLELVCERVGKTAIINSTNNSQIKIPARTTGIFISDGCLTCQLFQLL